MSTTDTTTTAITHIAQVVGVNAAAVSVAFTNINELLTTLSLVLASGYTLYRWFKDLKKKKS